jgi:hypothetical protein
MYLRVQLSVDTDRTVEAFVEYIKKNAAIPFTVPEIPEVKQEVSVDLGRIMANSEFVWIFKS